MRCESAEESVTFFLSYFTQMIVPCTIFNDIKCVFGNMSFDRKYSFESSMNSFIKEWFV